MSSPALTRLFLDYPWDYDLLSMNSSITWEIVQAHPEIPWNYYWLSMNPNITWDIVVAHPDRPELLYFEHESFPHLGDRGSTS